MNFKTTVNIYFFEYGMSKMPLWKETIFKFTLYYTTKTLIANFG